MKKLMISVVLAFAAMTLSAQESPIFLRKGTQSLSAFGSFSQNSLFQTTSGIMYNYFLDDDLALRANVRLGFNNENRKNTDSDFTTEETSNNFRLGAGLQKSLIKSRRFNGYIAGDALVGFLSQREKWGDNERKSSSFEFGLRPAMGIEFHFVDNFFVGLEWGYDVIFNSTKDEDSSYKTNNSILDVADLSSATIRVGFNF